MTHLLALLLFNQLSIASISDTISLKQLSGKWHIIMTNFPMWTKGDKTNPAFNYSTDQKRGRTGLSDKVTYIKKGKERSIIGFDYPQNVQNTAFIWKGKGLLSLLKSKWKIIYYSNDQQWMIIHFQKTLFTPEGYDIVSKQKTLNKDAISLIRNKSNELGLPELELLHINTP